jgi:hypothetical protein
MNSIDGVKWPWPATLFSLETDCEKEVPRGKLFVSFARSSFSSALLSNAIHTFCPWPYVMIRKPSNFLRRDLSGLRGMACSMHRFLFRLSQPLLLRVYYHSGILWVYPLPRTPHKKRCNKIAYK